MGLDDNHFEFDGDVIDSTQGVLGGGAWDAVEKVKATPSKDQKGYDFVLTCQHCARMCKVDIPWEELVTGAAGALPMDRETRQPWIAHGGVMYPPAHCPGDGQMLQIKLTPDKCAGYVMVGIKMGSLQEAWVTQHQAHVRQQLAAYRR